MIEWQEEGPGVFVSRAGGQLPTLTRVEWLKEQALTTRLRRARWCAHAGAGDGLQEMLVAVHRDSLLPAHKHLGKPESLLVVEGLATLKTFDDKGEILAEEPLGNAESGRPFYFRIPADTYHALKLETEFFVFQEVTLGPWRKENTLVAPWERSANA